MDLDITTLKFEIKQQCFWAHDTRAKFMNMKTSLDIGMRDDILGSKNDFITSLRQETMRSKKQIDSHVADRPNLPSHVGFFYVFLYILNMLTGQLIFQQETSTVKTMETPTALVWIHFGPMAIWLVSECGPKGMPTRKIWQWYHRVETQVGKLHRGFWRVQWCGLSHFWMDGSITFKRQSFFGVDIVRFKKGCLLYNQSTYKTRVCTCCN